MERLNKMEKQNETKVKVNGGYLVVSTKSDPGHPGISILYQTEAGDLMDIVGVEVKEENENKDIKVYEYEDPYNEDVTRTFTIHHDDIMRAFSGE